MKKNIKDVNAIFAIGALATLILFGTAHAEDQLWREAPTYPGAAAYTSEGDLSFGNSADIVDDQFLHEAPTYPGAAAYTSENAGPATISGIVNPNSEFVDDRGRTLRLANSDEGQAVQSLVGQRVEIKGTVMDDGGRQTVDVSNYKVIKNNVDDGDRY